MVPDFENYVNENSTSFVRVYLRKLPINHEIYTSNHHSLKNITLSNLVRVLHSYELCVGIKKDTSFLSSAYIEHVSPKIFLPSEETFPLSQIKYLRSSACQMLITAKSICSMCDTLEKKEGKSSKSDNLSAPAKLNAPIKFTSPERVKLTVQNYRLESKELKFELFRLKEEIESKSIPVDNELSIDFCTIMSNVDKS